MGGGGRLVGASTDDDRGGSSEDNEGLYVAVLQRLDVGEYAGEEGHRNPEKALPQHMGTPHD